MDSGPLLDLARGIEAQLNAEREANKRLTDDFNYNYTLLVERDKTIDLLEVELNTLSEELCKEKERAGTAINQLALAEQRCLHYDMTTAENKSLKGELQKARLEIAELSQSLTDTTAKLTSLQTKEAEYLRAASDNQIVIERYKMQHSTMVEKIEGILQENKACKAEVDDARKEIAELNSSLNKMRRNYADLQIERDSLNTRLEHVTTLSNEKTATTKNELQHKIASLERDLQHKDEDLQRAVAKYKHDVEELRTELRTCKDAAEVAQKKADTELRRTGRKLEDALKVTTEQKAKIDELHEDISVLRDAMVKEKKRTSALRAELEAQQTDVEGSLRKRAVDAETRLRTVEEDLSAKVLEVTNLSAMVSKLTMALQMADKESARLKEVNLELEKQKNSATIHNPTNISLEKYEAVIKDMKEQMRRATECSRSLELENNSYRASLEEVKLKLDELHQDYDRLVEKNKHAAQSKDTVETLQKQLAEAEVENNNLRRKISMLMNGDPVDPDSIELLRKMQVHMKLAANMLTSLKAQNQSLTMHNRVLSDRVKRLIVLSPGEGRDEVRSAIGENAGSDSTGSNIGNGVAKWSKMESPQHRGGGKSQSHTSSPLRVPSAGAGRMPLFEEDAKGRINIDNLSDLPSNISLVDDLAEMSIKLQDILHEAYKEADRNHL